MNTILYANPYSLDATGFYFSSAEEYEAKAENLKDRFGNPVEEFEIDFIEGDAPELFRLAEINQSNIDFWFDGVDWLSDDSEEAYAVKFLLDLGLPLEEALERYEDVQIFHGTAEDYAMELIEECYDLPEIAQRYFDYEAFARDLELNGDIVEIERDRIVTNPKDF
jgi:hypothetical protein